MVIASHIPGRLRLKGDDLRNESRRQFLIQDVSGLDPSVTVEAATHCGSLLIRYDPRRLAPSRLAGWVEANAAAAPRPLPAVAARPRPAAVWSRPLLGREANRAAKYGMLASTVVMLLALTGSVRLHAAAGGLNLAFLLVHLAHHRTKLLR